MIFIILLAAAAFAAGYKLGTIAEPKIKKRTAPYDTETLRLEKEYKNFLDYNGEDQY